MVTQDMKTVFMGTPDFAVPPLKALVEAGYEVAAVVTQPDKPKGRGKTLMPTPVKEEALMHEIPVYQPKRGNQSGYHYRSCIWPDHSKGNSGTSEVWMHQYPCFAASEIQRCSSDPAGSH